MNFHPTEEQEMLRSLARTFAEGEIAPVAAQIEESHSIPEALWRALRENNFFALLIPEEFGGGAIDYVSYAMILEELARISAAVAITVSVHNSVTAGPIQSFGTDAQRRKWLPLLAKSHLGAFALTEPGSGSDAGSLRTTAVRDGDGGTWRINGTKQWCTNGSHASTFLLFARTDPATEGARGVSAFLLDADHVEVTREEEKLGLHSSSTADLRLDGVAVDGDRLLHEERKGFVVAMATLDGGRIGIAAQAVGIAQAALDTARDYALERVQFGSRIADFQAIRFKLADMATEIAAARQLTHRAAWLKQAGLPHGPEGAMAKLFASQVAVRASQEAIQVLGGYGYTREFPAERFYRDAKITEIYEGTSEIQRIVIARDLLRGADGRGA
jgi:alkylation response protein AidB-like acyl-CoA dehydrogenase